MAERCTGDCLKCNTQQQIYCASQRSYAILRNQEAIVARLDRLNEALARISGPVESIIGPTAQQGPGAENRGSES